MGKRETPLMKRVHLDLGGRSDVRLFRNDVGEAYQGKAYAYAGGGVVIPEPRRVTYGLAPGSHDLIGWRTVEVTPDMVGCQVAVFVSVETKAGKGRLQTNQRLWMEAVEAAGGLTGVARSVKDARQIVAPDGKPASEK